MNKKFLVAVVSAICLVLFMATGVLAAQNVDQTVFGDLKDYSSTAKVFNADGTTNYPNEIYLPNETSPANYRIHSNYTATTDACASCHATHTGVGEALLQFGSVYDTCMACHDGTVTTTYDVSHGQIGTTGARTSAGLFSGDPANSGSNHNVSGALSAYAAPGGAGTAGFDTKANPNTDSKGSTVSWDVEFGCQSCHTPHGQGGNARLLNPDVNGYAWAQKNAGNTVGVSLTQVDATTYTSDWNKDKVNDTWIVGYPYSSKVYVNGTATTVSIDNSLGYTQVKFAVAPAGAVTADFFAAVAVKMTVDNYLTANETVTHGSGLNTFCGACHTDYNTQGNKADGKSGGSGSVLTGTYTEAYRHQVGYTYGSAAKLVSKNMKLETGNIVTCATCHVAHGTDSQYWNDTLTMANNGALPSTIAAADLKEIAGSSALKRLPNMGVCESCHAKGAGNQGYGVVTPVSGTVSGPNYNTVSNFLDYVGNASAISSPSYVASKYGPFLSGNGLGFFKNETYIGSAACQSCHADYYQGWSAKGHSKSFQNAQDFDLAGIIANQVGDHTVALTTPLTINNLGGTAGTKGTGTDTINSYTYNIAADGTLTYDAYTRVTVAGTPTTYTYTWNGKVSFNLLTKPSYLWMDHYVVQDASAGIPSGIANAVTGSSLGATPNAYGRIAVLDETTGTITPYLSSSLPAFPTMVSWFGGSSPTFDTTKPGEGCLSCHAPKLANASGTPDKTIGCETCHGPASRHVKAPMASNILNPKAALTFDQQVNLCQTCHSGRHNAINNTNVATSNGYKASKHYANGIGCTTCHDIHSDEHPGQLVLPANQLCASCHGKAIDGEAYIRTTSWTANHGFQKPLP